MISLKTEAFGPNFKSKMSSRDMYVLAEDIIVLRNELVTAKQRIEKTKEYINSTKTALLADIAQGDLNVFNQIKSVEEKVDKIILYTENEVSKLHDVLNKTELKDITEEASLRMAINKLAFKLEEIERNKFKNRLKRWFRRNFPFFYKDNK